MNYKEAHFGFNPTICIMHTVDAYFFTDILMECIANGEPYSMQDIAMLRFEGVQILRSADVLPGKWFMAH
jgi:hypothetical protein